MALVNLLRQYPKAKRTLGRSSSAENAIAACKFEEEYFDGTREQGYGGYRYDGRWVPIAQDIVDHFGLKPGMKVLDVGCAKGFLMKDLEKVCPGLKVYGFDISSYALRTCEAEATGHVVRADAGAAFPFADNSFDCVLSINTLHNLERPRLIAALKEIERVAPSGQSYIQIDAYRNDEELDAFKQWVLTAKTYLKPEEWEVLFKEADFHGDYHWTILEIDPEWNAA